MDIKKVDLIPKKKYREWKLMVFHAYASESTLSRLFHEHKWQSLLVRQSL